LEPGSQFILRTGIDQEPGSRFIYLRSRNKPEPGFLKRRWSFLKRRGLEDPGAIWRLTDN
jgi:hypothetical protein